MYMLSLTLSLRFRVSLGGFHLGTLYGPLRGVGFARGREHGLLLLGR